MPKATRYNYFSSFSTVPNQTLRSRDSSTQEMTSSYSEQGVTFRNPASSLFRNNAKIISEIEIMAFPNYSDIEKIFIEDRHTPLSTIDMSSQQ